MERIRLQPKLKVDWIAIHVQIDHELLYFRIEFHNSIRHCPMIMFSMRNRIIIFVWFRYACVGHKFTAEYEVEVIVIVKICHNNWIYDLLQI